MVPGALTNFFMASAGAAAALLGLLFVSISISPEEKITATAAVEKRISAYSALISLMNAFIISLVALIPGNFGVFVLIFSVVSFSITLQNGYELLRPHEGASSMGRRIVLTVLNAAAYVAEGYNGVQLIIDPHDASPVYGLTVLLLVVYMLSVIRAWELLGGMRRSPAALSAHAKRHSVEKGAQDE
jgi:hypothetical protein